MTAPGADPHGPLRALLVSRAGGYLRNTVRTPGLTCAVCAAFVTNGYQRCMKCNDQFRKYGRRLADLVVPLTYGVAEETSGTLMHRYKSNRPGELWVDFSLLLLTALRQHGPCVARTVREPIAHYVGVPSLRGRPGVHPLLQFTDDAKITSPSLTLLAADGARTTRTVQSGTFTISDPAGISGRHVVVLDDTWTTGGNAQSAALALRDAGASHVSIVVVARWINFDYQPTAALARQHVRGDFDPMLCPVTGGACPT